MERYKNTALILLTLALTGITVILGAIPLRALRQNLGSISYWITSTVIVLALFALQMYGLAIGLLSLVLIVGVFTDLHESGHSILSASATAVSVTFFLFIGGFLISQATGGFMWRPYVQENVQKYLELTQMLPEKDPEMFVSAMVIQTPSVIYMIMSLSLFFSLIFEKRISSWVKKSSDAKLLKSLNNFKLPSVFIWVGIFTVLGSFFHWPQGASFDLVKTASLNTLNVFVLLYFFQGLAIISCFFHVFKISLFWRIFWLILVVTQLFVAVAFIGFIDFWLNFRFKIVQRAKKIKSI
ncbi:MAG: DUF2232 domain-containing protein [Bdellovibrionaceae bacterium]|jgi:hypothetical protein|nr:DUF2232 domain-containing protein [Pseudobdellovibrionaceae bacterium]